MNLARLPAALAEGLAAFRRTLKTAPLRDLVAPAAANDNPELAQLQGRFRALQAKAASGTRGSVAARRELADVRLELMRRGMA